MLKNLLPWLKIWPLGESKSSFEVTKSKHQRETHKLGTAEVALCLGVPNTLF